MKRCPQCGYEKPQCPECAGRGCVPTRTGELVPCKTFLRRARAVRQRREEQRRWLQQHGVPF